jgi:deoxycytidine triphosphate deaminase
LDPASVNLTFAPSFRVFRKVHAVIDAGKDTGYRQLTDKIIVPDGGHILIMPGETVLDITRERLRLGPLAVHSGTAIAPDQTRAEAHRLDKPQIPYSASGC